MYTEEIGYFTASMGSIIYGITVGLVKFFGKTHTSDAVLEVTQVLAIILFSVGLIMVCSDNSNNPKNLLVGIIKTVLFSLAIYLLLAHLLGFFISSVFLYMILAFCSPVVIVIRI